MTRLLLTGGAGYIGSHIAVKAAEAGFSVIIFDNFSNSSIDVIEKIRQITTSDISCVEGDIRDPDDVRKVFSDNDISDVIHLAGLKSVEESVAKPDLYLAVNLEGTRNLVAAMEQHDVYRLIFSSSATVYGVPEYLPLDEEHPLSPVNPYAESKYQVERFLQSASAGNPRLRIISLRYFNPIGSHESGLLGDNARALRANLMPMIARVLTGKREYLEVYGNDYDTRDGSCLRDYIHIMDLVEGHLDALKYLDGFSGYENINLGTGDGVSVLEMITAFQEITGQEIPVRISPRRAGDVPSCYADCSKAKALLDWKATRSVKDMCESVWHWCQTMDTW